MGRARKEIEQFSFVDNPELHRVGRAEVLIDKAEVLLNSSAKPTRNDEQVLFKGLHACGYALAHLENGWSAGRRAKTLKEIYARIRNELTERNLGLVYDKRHRFARVLDEAEAISEGCLALWRSVVGFDPWRGFRFSTYACSFIFRVFQMIVRHDARRLNLVNRLGGRLVSEQYEVPQIDTDKQLLIERIQLVLTKNSAKLTDKERYIIARRFLHDPNEQPETLESIGKAFGVSKERIRQRELKALEKLHLALTGEKRTAPKSRRRRRKKEKYFFGRLRVG
mgnify:FL=1